MWIDGLECNDFELDNDPRVCACRFCKLSISGPERAWVRTYVPQETHALHIRITEETAQRRIQEARLEVDPTEGVLLPIEEEEYKVSPRRTYTQKRKKIEEPKNLIPDSGFGLGRTYWRNYNLYNPRAG